MTLVCLIHNFEEDRLFNIRKSISKIVSLIEDCRKIEISDQTLPTFKKRTILTRSYQVLLFKIKRNKYLSSPHKYRKILSFIVREFIHNARSPKRIRSYQKVVSIEHIVASKHIEAVNQFIKDGSRALIVFESDAIIKDDSAYPRIVKWASELDEPIYLNLGEGFNFERLGVTKLTISAEEIFSSQNILTFSRCFTNTNVAYLINRKTATLFLEFISKLNPKEPLFPIDWLFESFFLHTNRIGKEIKMLYLNPESVLHGSRGIYKAWR